MTVVYALYALRRGGLLYALAALVAEAIFWLGMAATFHWSSQIAFGVMAAFGTAMAVGGRLALSAPSESSPWKGARESGNVWRGGGALVVAITTVLVVLVEGAPLSDTSVAGATPVLALWLLVAWLALAFLLQRPVVGWAVIGWSFAAAAYCLEWAWPAWHAAWYGIALLALAVAWSQMRPAAERWLAVSGRELTAVSRLLYLFIAFLAVAAAGASAQLRAYPVAFLLAGEGIAWLADGLRWKDTRVFAAASASAVMSAAAFGWVARSAEVAAVAAGACALVLSLLSVSGPRRADSWSSYFTGGAAVMASVLVVTSLGRPGYLSLALALVALSWALLAWNSDTPEFCGIGGVAAGLSAVAALWWQNPPSWVSLLVLAVLAGVLLLPRAAVSASPGSRAKRLIVALAAAGLFALVEADVIGLASWASTPARCSAGWTSAPPGPPSVWSWQAATCRPGLRWNARRWASIPVSGSRCSACWCKWTARASIRPSLTSSLRRCTWPRMGVLWASRGPDRRVPAGTDVAAFAVGVAVPLAMAVVSFEPSDALRHGLWALALALTSTAVGLAVRTRVYFLGGIGVLVLDALWLSRSVLLGLPSWVWIGTVGLALMAGGLTYARREALEGVGRRLQRGMESWR